MLRISTLNSLISKSNIILLLCSITFTNLLHSQTSPIILVKKNTEIKPKSEVTFIFPFKAGDEINSKIELTNGKFIKEFKIFDSSKNTNFKVKKKSKTNHSFEINEDKLLSFQLKNSSKESIFCDVNIQYLPKSNASDRLSLIDNKNQFTRSLNDKNEIIRFDTITTTTITRVPVKWEKKDEKIIDKYQRVHSLTKIGNENRTSLIIPIPDNRNTDLENRELIGWAYWIGVGDEAKEAWEFNVRSIKNLVSKFSMASLSPLGALALEVIGELVMPKLGEDVSYAIVDSNGKDKFLKGGNIKDIINVDHGKGTAGYRYFNDNKYKGKDLYLLLENDNLIQGIDVHVVVVAIYEVIYYKKEVKIVKLIQPIYKKTDKSSN